MNLVLEYNVLQNDYLQLKNSVCDKESIDFLSVELQFHKNKVLIMKSLANTTGFQKTVMMQYFAVFSLSKAFTDVNRLFIDLFGVPKYDDYSNFLKALK